MVIADTVTIDGPCTVKFSPKGGVTDAIVKLVDSSKSSIRLLAYSFTSDQIATALVNAHNRGVDVQIILDKTAPTANGGKYGYVVASGIPVFIDSKHAIAHNKVIIVDSKMIENGSFNYTSSAENSNGENALICPSISGATAYTVDWTKHQSHSVKAVK